MVKQSILTNNTRQEFLATFFTQHDHYEEKEVNGYYLVQQIKPDGSTIIAIYTKERFDNYLLAKKAAWRT